MEAVWEPKEKSWLYLVNGARIPITIDRKGNDVMEIIPLIKEDRWKGVHVM